MQLFSSIENQFYMLPQDCIKLIFDHLNTKTLFNICASCWHFQNIFIKHYKKQKEKEIEAYIKMCPQFWKKMMENIKNGIDIILPKSELIKKIILKLTEDIMPFYLLNSQFYINCIMKLRNKKSRTQRKNIDSYCKINFGLRYKTKIFGFWDRKRCVAITESDQHIIINIPTISTQDLQDQIESYIYKNKKLYVIFEYNHLSSASCI